jgi:hypothetical protein
MTTDSTDLTGTWLGTYWHNAEPTRFEASLVQGGNALSGSILDDGPLGEAQLAGEIIGRRVKFSKQYVTANPRAIEYTGTLNEEANLIQGVWVIVGTKHSGNWEMRRSGDDLMQQLRRRMEQKIPVGAR